MQKNHKSRYFDRDIDTAQLNSLPLARQLQVSPPTGKCTFCRSTFRIPFTTCHSANVNEQISSAKVTSDETIMGNCQGPSLFFYLFCCLSVTITWRRGDRALKMTTVMLQMAKFIWTTVREKQLKTYGVYTESNTCRYVCMYECVFGAPLTFPIVTAVAPTTTLMTALTVSMMCESFRFCCCCRLLLWTDIKGKIT